MALLRFLAAAAACIIFAGAPVLADEIQEISQQYRQGDLAGALDRTNSHLAQNPGNAQARFLKGLILSDQGKSSEALAIFTGLTEDFPEMPEPYNNLAVLHASQGRYDAAMEALQAAIRAYPGYATAHENLGDIHAKLASIAYDKALALDSKNKTAQTKLTLIRTLLEPAKAAPETSQPIPAR